MCRRRWWTFFALLHFALASSYNPNISNGTCYWAEGKRTPSRFIPCGNDAGGHVSCCESGDMCLSENACFNGECLSHVLHLCAILDMLTPFPVYVTYLAGCTDIHYADSTCPDKAPFSGNPSSTTSASQGNGPLTR